VSDIFTALPVGIPSDSIDRTISFRTFLLRKSSWDAGPGRARRPARTGVFIVAGGASSAMDDSSEESLRVRNLGRPGGRYERSVYDRSVSRAPYRSFHVFLGSNAAMNDYKQCLRKEGQVAIPGRPCIDNSGPRKATISA